MAGNGRVVVARQPILDGRSRIVGHELLYRATEDAEVACIGDVSRASARVMLNALGSLDMQALLGDGIGFFNVDAEMLHSEMVESLPANRVVFEILETVEPTQDVAQRCRELRRRGFSIALDDYVYGDPRECLVDLVQYIKVDLPAVPEPDLTRLVARLRRRRPRLLAEKVETADEFEHCQKLGFELFQGFFFARPSTLAGESLDPARSTVMELLRMMSRGAGIPELSAMFKRHANLGLTLLRLVNSVEFVRRQRIQNVEQALVLLGERRLRRWLSLLLFAGDDNTQAARPLLQTAAIRGRLLETLARDCAAPLDSSEGQSHAFLTGMLSLADVVLGITRAALVESLNLESEIAEALTEGSGALGDLLHLAEALEQGDFGRVAETLDALGLSSKQLLDAEVSAIRWASDLASAPDKDAS